jgi:hypothetical protein
MKIRSLLCIFYLLFLSACAVMGDRTVNVTEAQIQQKLNERLALPFSLLKIFDVNLSNSLVKFDEKSGRLNTSLDTALTSPFFKESLAGKLAISGKLRFDPIKQAVVLDEPKVESVDLKGLDGKYGDIIQALAKNIGGEMLNGMTLYEVKPEDLKIGTTQYTPKDMQVTNQGLQIRLSPQR